MMDLLAIIYHTITKGSLLLALVFIGFNWPVIGWGLLLIFISAIPHGIRKYKREQAIERLRNM